MGLRSVYLAVLLDKMGAMMVLPLLPFLARSKLASIGASDHTGSAGRPDAIKHFLPPCCWPMIF